MKHAPSNLIRLALLSLVLASVAACSHTKSGTPIDEAAYKLSAAAPASQRLATAQLCMSTAEDLEETNPSQALGYYLQAAKATRDGAIAGDAESRTTYNRAVASATHLSFVVTKGASKSLTAPGPDGEWKLEIAVPQYHSKPLSRIDFLDRSETITEENKTKRLRSSITRDGIGGTLVAYQKATPERLKMFPFRLPIGTSVPVTAVADFSGQNRAKIRVYDTMLSDEVTLSGKKLPLAADFTAALVKLMAYAPTKNIGFDAMKHPEEYLEDTGIFFIQPYRPGKIPVLLVHGLKDQPSTWRNTYNELLADPVIRKNFQFWFFRYPTGFPIAYSANLLRTHLDNAYGWASKNGGGSELRQMVIAGHSMGSVISSINVRDSGTKLEQKYLTKSIEEIDVDERTKDALMKLVSIKPPEYVTRAILVAGPHRGSKYAVGIVGALGNLLIKLPKKITTLDFFNTNSRPIYDFLTDTGREALLETNNGVRALRPYNPALMAFVELPVGSHVTYHSILGNQGKDVPIEESSDSVVDYWSSRLEGAASEKIVPSKHPAHDHPDGIAEIQRILHEHLKKLGRR